jgi:hypothetical protein
MSSQVLATIAAAKLLALASRPVNIQLLCELRDVLSRQPELFTNA